MSEMNVHQRFASLWAWLLIIVFSIGLLGVIVYFARQQDPVEKYPATRDTTIINQETGSGRR